MKIMKSETRGKIRKTEHKIGEDIDDSIHDMGDTVREMGENVLKGLPPAKKEAKKVIKQVQYFVDENLPDIAPSIEEKVEAVEEYIRKKPIQAAAMVLVAGVILGRLFK